MNQIEVKLTNCYGIKGLDQNFEFTVAFNRRSFAIYAPNGSMKSSFAKTFERLRAGQAPEELRYNRPSSCSVMADSQPISKESIFVIQAEIDTKADIPAVTNLLVQPHQKAKYDALVVNLEKQKQKALNALQKISKLTKKQVEEQLPRDLGASTFIEGVKLGLGSGNQEDLSAFPIAVIFDPKALAVIQTSIFQEKFSDFNQRYDELFQAENTIYRKGVFNPARAGNAFGTLQKERFFDAGHRVHLDGDTDAISKEELDARIQAIHSRIDADETLKRLREDLAKTAESRALTELLESLDSHQFEFLARMTKPDQLADFRRKLWGYCLSQSPEAITYRDDHERIATDIETIETEAGNLVPEWHNAVDRFNQRFINMPFTLRIANQTEATLGKEPARLLFVFKDDDGSEVEWKKDEVKTLSQGERRALHLLGFIFEVEARKKSGQSTLFIADDPADSFDYKNKHAIVQYLEDLTKVDHFRQIILTHNFDLFRTLTRFVHREHCLVVVKGADSSISLQKMEGIENIFTRMWKPKVASSKSILIATIPFTRNIIEYTRGDVDPDYLLLTSLLHWKANTKAITVKDYLIIYNKLFGTTHSLSNEADLIHEWIVDEAKLLAGTSGLNELDLENKIVLSIATRILAEQQMTDRLRLLKSDPNYWCTKNSQFGSMLGELKTSGISASDLELLECVSVTVSSNIHLNSFMYEPLLDLSVEHLASLFKKVLTYNSVSAAVA